MAAKGWISVHRKIWDSWVWRDRPFSKGQAWIDILLLANHEDGKTLMDGQLIEIKRGEHITSEPKLATRWGWSRTKVRNFLKMLEDDGMIENIKEDRKRTRLKVLNYSDYQDIENNRKTSEEQVKDKQRTSKEQEKNINNNDNNLINIKEDEEERVLPPEIGKVPTHCQDDDPVLAFIDQVSSYYTTLTGRLTSPNDEVVITDISKHTTNFEIVKEAMDNTFRNYKPRYKGDKVRSFRYFVPGILERIAIEKERQRRREVKVANGNEFLGTETERAPKFDKSKFLYKGG